MKNDKNDKLNKKDIIDEEQVLYSEQHRINENVGTVTVDINALISILKIIFKSIENGDTIKLVDTNNKSIINSLSNIVGYNNRKSANGIKVKINKNNNIQLDISVAVKYDTNISDICKTTQSIIEKQIKYMLNYDVTDITIMVQEII